MQIRMNKIILMTAVCLLFASVSFAGSPDPSPTSSRGVAKKMKAEKAFHLSEVFGAKDKLLLTVGRFAKGFKIKILNDEGKIVYLETHNLEADFARVYDISALEGKVTVIVTDRSGNEEKFQF
jgi:hypothetical protein